MVETVVRYLRSQSVPFRLLSFPFGGATPTIAHVLRPDGSQWIEARILRLDGQAAVAVVPRGQDMNLLRLRSELGVAMVELGSSADLPWPYTQSSEPIPALGSIFGTPLLIDVSIGTAPLVGFGVFSDSDFIEIAFDDYSRIEQPRIVSLAGAAELPVSLH